MWANESVFYQIYPLGFCGAPKENDGVLVNRIGKIAAWADLRSSTPWISGSYSRSLAISI